MGTRNLTVVVAGGEVRVAQYCQWDGYPDGQGVTALEFLRDKMIREVFLDKIRQSSWITQEEHKAMWVSCGANPDSDMVSWDVSKNFSAKYPHLHRDCGAKIFELMQNSSNGLKLQNDVEFAADSLFCEWAYVVDFDKNTFEVYTGFVQSPLSSEDRFSYLQKEGETPEYYPVKMIQEFDLKNLPSNEEFLESFKNKEEE